MAGKAMLAVRRCAVWLLFVVSLSALAEVPYCPPSLEAPLEGDLEGMVIGYPRGHIFQPLIADPREARFFLAYRDYERPNTQMHVGVLGVGETFPLYRRTGDCASNGIQLDISGGGVARFVLDQNRNDLIDADYRLGLPLSWRRGNWSVRARIYHESSHLGEDELFQAGTASRVKRSADGVDVLGGYDKEKWRVYYGGEYLYYHHPDIDPWGIHLGGEYYGGRSMFGGTARGIGGLDVKAFQEYNYDADVSLKTGLSFGGKHAGQHHLQVMLEWYGGHANEGVLFEEKIHYVGIAVYFGF